MKLVFVMSFVALCCISSSVASDLIVGTSYNGRLIWQQKVEHMSIPFKKRVKEVFFSDPGMNVIKGIIVRETPQTQGSATITAGGVGFTYVNIRFKSERGIGLYYITEIYV